MNVIKRTINIIRARHDAHVYFSHSWQTPLFMSVFSPLLNIKLPVREKLFQGHYPYDTSYGKHRNLRHSVL